MGCWTRTNDFFLQEDTELIAVKKALSGVQRMDDGVCQKLTRCLFDHYLILSFSTHTPFVRL